jgi:hypothetical protein
MHNAAREVKSATLRPQQTSTDVAQLPATLPALGPGAVGHWVSAVTFWEKQTATGENKYSCTWDLWVI